MEIILRPLVFPLWLRLHGRTRGEVVGIETGPVIKIYVHSWVSSASTFGFHLSRTGNSLDQTVHSGVRSELYFPHFLFLTSLERTRNGKSEKFCVGNVCDGGVEPRTTSKAREFVSG